MAGEGAQIPVRGMDGCRGGERGPGDDEDQLVSDGAPNYPYLPNNYIEFITLNIIIHKCQGGVRSGDIPNRRDNSFLWDKLHSWHFKGLVGRM